jgi:alkylation response protein AidB-like acyl-CoA dehydrogenase
VRIDHKVPKLAQVIGIAEAKCLATVAWGLMAETPISRRYRDGRIGSIVGGAVEGMLSITYKHLDIMPAHQTKL